MRFLLTAVLMFSVAACHSHDEEGFDTFQACYDDHHGGEGKSVQESIVICCLEHPINGVTEVCGTTAAACVTYVTANATGPTTAEIQTSCDDYITQKGM